MSNINVSALILDIFLQLLLENLHKKPVCGNFDSMSEQNTFKPLKQIASWAERQSKPTECYNEPHRVSLDPLYNSMGKKKEEKSLGWGVVDPNYKMQLVLCASSY